MSTFSRDVWNSLDDLDKLIRLEPDPIARLELVRLVRDSLAETLEETTDSAIYEVRLASSNIDEVCDKTLLKRWRVKAAILRHCAANGIATPRSQELLLDFVPLF